MTPHKLNCILAELGLSINEAKETAEKHRIIMDALVPYKGALIMRKNQVSELHIVDFTYGEYQIRSLLGGYLGAVSFYVPHRSLTPIDYPTAVALEVKLEDLLQQHFESLEVLRHQLHKIHGEIRYLRSEISMLLPNNTFFITPFFSVAKLVNRADLLDGRNLLCYGEIKVVNTVHELFNARKENE